MTEKGKRGGLRPGAGRKKGTWSKVNPLFEFYLWVLVELTRDVRGGARRLQLKEASTLVTKTLGVDWHPDAFASYYKRGKKVAETEIDGAAVLQALRQNRDAENWQTSPLDIVLDLDASGRRRILNLRV